MENPLASGLARTAAGGLSPSCEVTLPPVAPLNAAWTAPTRRFFQGSKTRFTVGSLAIFALAVLVYLPLLPGSFVMDDWRLVGQANPLVTGELTARTVWFQTDFPLTLCAWWAEWLAWGSNPAGYHAVNIVLQAISGFLLWRILLRLKIPGAWLAAAIFTVHPVAVGSVARIAELKNTLSLPFFLASFWGYLRYEAAALYPGDGKADSARRDRGTAWFSFSFIAFLLALLSKTSTIMLPVMLLGCAAWQRGRVTRRDVLHVTPFFVLALSFGLMSVWFQKYQALAGEVIPRSSFGERLGIAGRDFWFYAEKAVLPMNLTVFYSRWNTGVSALADILPVVLLGLAFLLCLRYRRSWGRHALFGLGAFAILLFPALGFFDAQCFTKFQVSDHLQYLPLIAPVSLATAWLASQFPRPIFQCAGVAILLALSVLAFQRTRVFATEEGLMRDTLARNPAAWPAQNDLGVVLAKQGDFSGAAEHFQASLQSNPKNADAHSNLGKIFAMQGRLEDACAEFRAAIELNPSNPEPNENLAQILKQMGKDREAIIQFTAALKFTTKAETRLDLAEMHYRHHNFRRAATHYRRALGVKSDNVNGLNNLAWMLATCPDGNVRNGREAIQLAERACQLTHFKDSMPISTLAAAYAEGGRFPEAVDTAEKALQLQTAAGDMQLAAVNRQLLEFYRAGRSWHEPPVQD